MHISIKNKIVNDTELRSNLIENYLKRFPDFGRIEWKFIKQKAKLQVKFELNCSHFSIRVNIINEYFFLIGLL